VTKVAQGISLTKTEGHASNWGPVGLRNVLSPTSGSGLFMTLLTPCKMAVLQVAKGQKKE